jgi:hypothetical protein
VAADLLRARLRQSSAGLSGNFLAEGSGFSRKKQFALAGSDWTVSSVASFRIDLKAYI